jgi:hypothetical protein
MRKTIIIVCLFFAFNNLYSQNYYYSKRTESLKYIDSNGKNSSKVIKANTGNFKLEFEKNNIDGKDLFTEYINNTDMGYYSLTQKYTNREFNGQIFEQGLFYSTDYGSGVIVAYNINKTRLIIFKGDRIIQYDK